MSDLEYDSGDSSEEVSAEDSSLQTAETAAAGARMGQQSAGRASPQPQGWRTRNKRNPRRRRRKGARERREEAGRVPEGEGRSQRTRKWRRKVGDQLMSWLNLKRQPRVSI